MSHRKGDKSDKKVKKNLEMSNISLIFAALKNKEVKMKNKEVYLITREIDSTEDINVSAEVFGNISDAEKYMAQDYAETLSEYGIDVDQVGIEVTKGKGFIHLFDDYSALRIMYRVEAKKIR